MRHTLPLAPQFYVTAPQECPYRANQTERKLFTALQGDHADLLNNSLSSQGFRRSQNVLYRPACAECSACMSARIKVSEFRPTKSQKRIAKRNAALLRTSRAPWASEDQYDLFRRYLDARHSDGGMADMDVFEFAAMVEETPIKSRIIEYALKGEDHRDGDDPTGEMRAVCLTDVLEDGLSMVYSFFEPNHPELSLGTYMILDHIQIAIEANLDYIYLGYWVPGSPKMSYKANFSGLEIYRNGEWSAHSKDSDYSDALHPLASDPIAEQVGALKLPDIAANLTR